MSPHTRNQSEFIGCLHPGHRGCGGAVPLPGAAPVLDVEHLPDGPPAILGWQDWHAVVEPLCRRVSVGDADVFVLACASDPGLDAVRTATLRPVLGVFRCAVSAAVVRAERFGVIAIVEASKARHLAALRSMGLDQRLAAEIALNVGMDDLLDPVGVRARLEAAGQDLVAAGAGAVVLGCTGMAHHRAWLEERCGVPVIDPCQAAAAQAMAVVLAGLPLG